MKTCSTCKKSLRLDQFSNNKTKSDGLQSKCKPCTREYNQLYYPATKDRYRETRARSGQEVRERNQAIIFEYFLAHPCVDCGITDPRVLEFDHIGDDKLCDVANLMGRSVEVLVTEIAKCEVRCANCHRLKSYERLGNTWRERMFECMPS